MMKNFFNSNPNASLDNIVFEGRNKNYGAFVLRNEEGHTLRKALLLGISFCITLAVSPLVVNAFKTDAIPDIPTKDPGGIVILQPIDDTKPPEPEAVKPIQKTVKQFDSTVPTPTKVVKIEKPAAKIEEYDKAVAGTQDIKGDDPIKPYTPPVTDVPPFTIGNGTSTVKTDPVEDPNKIQPKVDVNADFVGGINKFRSKVLGNLDGSDFEDQGMIKTEVSFVVEKDGSISQVVAKGKDQYFNKEAERAVRSVKGIWKPAELNGKKVRSYFRIPITLKFE